MRLFGDIKQDEQEKMKIESTTISDVLVIMPDLFEDERGFFMETYQAQHFKALGISSEFLQDNHSGSSQGVLRGMHYQIERPQGKLVRVAHGEVFDVAVDLRKSSDTYGKWVGATLTAENKHQLWIPPGFAHGFYVLSDWADLLYKVTEYYAPEWDRVLRWDDPEIGIVWPLLGGVLPQLSSKDADGGSLAEAELFD
jgi:dTDP-4-dehydrorhamnose 3,5-epimerase